MASCDSCDLIKLFTFYRATEFRLGQLAESERSTPTLGAKPGSSATGTRAIGTAISCQENRIDPHKITKQERHKPRTAQRNMYAPRDSDAMFCLSLAGRAGSDSEGGISSEDEGAESSERGKKRTRGGRGGSDDEIEDPFAPKRKNRPGQRARKQRCVVPPSQNIAQHAASEYIFHHRLIACVFTGPF